jgi:hypothetical protein
LQARRHSASAPAQLRGKTISLAWSDSRVEKIIASGRERPVDSGFSSCSPRVLHGKEAGLASIQYMTFNNKEPVELTSINVTSTNCSVAAGNSFAQ